jgi:hypothetical protein
MHAGSDNPDALLEVDENRQRKDETMYTCVASALPLPHSMLLRFEHLDLSKDTDSFTALFELPVSKDMLISDVK